MTEEEGTGTADEQWFGRKVARTALAVGLSLLGSVAACGRFGFDLLPLDDGSLGGAGGADGGSGAVGTSGASGSAGSRGLGGSQGLGGSGGSPIDPDGGVAGASGNAGAGGNAGSTTGGDAGSTSGGAGGAAGTGGAGGAAGAGGSTSLPLCDDGTQNGNELATDCGGPDCAPCPCSFGAPELLGNPNYAGNQLWAPSLSNDALTLYVAVVVPGVSEQVAVTTRPDRGNTFDFASSVPAPVSQSVEGTPHISLDGLSLYFFSERAGSGSGARDLYVATRSSPSGNFDTATPLTSVNSSSLDHLPWTNGDELTLYFASLRGGNMDIWRSTRASRGDAFGAPAAVNELNSSADDNGMTLTQDERTVIIASNRPNGAGGYDLYQAARASTSEPFSTPEPLTALNTSAVETDPSLSPDGAELFFVSTRNGANEIWRSLRTCP